MSHDGAWIHPTARLGVDVTVGPGAFVDAEACLEDGVQIAPLVYVGPRVRVGRGARVAPGAVVMTDVPSFAIVEPSPSTITGYSDNAGLATHHRPAVPSAGGSSDREALAVEGVRWINMPSVPDLRGTLVVCEFEQCIPFPVRRTFVVYDVPNAKIRGEHAHHQCHQLLVCLHGSLRVMIDDGKNRQTVDLENPSRGLYLPPLTWGTQFGFSRDAVLFVYASEAYDVKDYVRNYEDFRRIRSGA